MSLSIPVSQKYSSDIQVFKPEQHWIRITPNQVRDVITLQETNSSNTVTFELSPDNCVNLAASYMEWEEKIYWNKASDMNTALKVHRFNTFNLSTIRVYNITGSLICDLDFQYNDYRDIAAQLAKKVIVDDNYFNPEKELFSAMNKVWNNTTGRWELQDKIIDMPEGNKPTKDTPMANGENIYKVRMVLGELYNTILSLSNDMFFGEKIFIQFTFGPRNKSVLAVNASNAKDWPNPQPQVDLFNLELYACYNTDPDCNANTLNWVYRHPIDFNDFNIVQTTVTNSTATPHFQYNFTIDSSIGPYVKYILYTAVDQGGITVAFEDDSRFRWLLNDFVYTPDFLYVSNQDSYYQMQKMLTTTYFDQYNPKPFPQKFIEILKFTADNNLTNIKSRGGRPLDQQLKITFDCYNSRFGKGAVRSKDDDTEIVTVTHRFYIITGRILEVGMRGIQRVI